MNSETERLKKQLLELTKELLDGTEKKRPMHELEEIRQKISDISSALSMDDRKIHDIY
jgi:hypothetical protein